MSREGAYMVYCLERYRHARGLTGREVAAYFRKHGLYDYVMEFFGAFHTMGEELVFRELDEHVRRSAGRGVI